MIGTRTGKANGRSRKRSGPGRWARAFALLLGMSLVWVAGAPAAAADRQDGQDERITALERAVNELRRELQRLAETGAPDARYEELERRIEVLADELERLRGREDVGALAGGEPGEGWYGLAPAASKVYQASEGPSFGGYGEALFQSFDSTTDAGTPSGAVDQFDFLRLILYSGYKFNESIVFNSEVEIEHASTGKEGSVSVEFAYVDFLIDPKINARAGMVLVPVGFVNELHEPPIFLGARRPEVEQVIIPTTWRENGAGVHGDVGPFAYRAYLTTSLDAAGFSAAEGLRGGRQKGSKARAEDLAVSGRLDFNGIPGLLVGGSFFAGDTGQGRTTPGGQTFGGRVRLWDAHAEWRWRGLQARGLWTEVDVDDAAAISELTGETVGSEMSGWYAEVGYDVLARRDAGGHEVIPFARFEQFDTQESTPGATGAFDRESLTVGLVYKPIPQVAVKVDFQDLDNAAGSGVDQWNVALGYLF